MDIASLIFGGPLPEQLDVPLYLHRQLERLWRRSVASQTEWGLTLTVDRAGRTHGRHAHGGTDEDFAPDLTIPRQERLLGAFHTHVYVTGDTGMAFSDNDFVWLLTHPEVTLSLLQSGAVLFAMGSLASRSIKERWGSP
jgi:hypothetical protein